MMIRLLVRDLLVVSVIALILNVASCDDKHRKLEETNRNGDSLSELLRHQKKISDSLRGLVKNEETAKVPPIYFGREFEKIDNPEEFIITSLREKPEEIPLDPVLGGTMEFRHIEVLSKDWVLAEYDDGHVQGRSIYEYSMNKNGELQFEVILSKHPE